MSFTDAEPPVLWREGMLFRPQHLQAWQRHIDHRFAALSRQLEGHPYGLITARWNAAALADSELLIEELVAVLPSGTWIEAPGATAGPAPRLIADELRASGRLRILVGVPRDRSARRLAESEVDQGPFASRLNSLDREVFDENTGEGPQPVERRVQRLELLIGEERAGFECLPIGEVVLAGERGGRPEFAADFAPPCLRAGAAPGLVEVFTGAVSALGGTVSELGRTLAGPGPSAAEGDDSQSRWRLLVGRQLLARLLPLAPVAGRLHPFEMHRTLLEAVATLSTFEEVPGELRDLPGYEHDDPLGSISELSRLLGRLGRALWPTSSGRAVPFEPREDDPREAVARLEAQWLDSGCQLHLKVERNHGASLGREETFEILRSHLKLLPSSRVASLARRGAGRGFELGVDEDAEMVLPDRERWFYFPLVSEERPHLWEDLRRELVLSGYWVREPETPIRLELYAERRDG